MVGVGSRWNKTYRLLNIRLGPGAAILPPQVTRIHLQFTDHVGKGHVGGRKFWKECSKRLKYHNPAVPIIVNRTLADTDPSTMTLYFKNPAAPDTPPPDAPTSLVQPTSSGIGESPAQPPAWDERTVVIDMKHLHSNDILAAFLKETEAAPVTAAPEDVEGFRRFAELDKVAKRDRARMRAILAEERKAKEMLRRAKAGSSAE